MSINQKFVQALPSQLYGSGAAIGDASITLVALTDPAGNVLTLTDFGTKGWGTLEPSNGSQQESFTFSGVTINGNGSTTLTGIKTTLFKYPYTETSGLRLSHPGGSTVIISNTPSFYNQLASLNDDETINGTWTFTAPNYPVIDVPATLPTTDGQFATKKYVDGVAVQGAPKAAAATYGITRLSLDPAVALTPIAVGDNDTRVPSQGENDALVGMSGLTPSSTNKYVDNSYTETGLDQTQTTQNATVKVGEADATSKYNLLAQSFIPAISNIAGVRLYKIADTGSFTGTVTVALYADLAGSPTGAALATVTISNADWLTYPVGEFRALFAASYAMAVGSTYWIKISTSTADNSNHPNVGSNSAGGYASGSVKYWNTTDGWVAVATIDLYFKTLDVVVTKVVKSRTDGLIDPRYIPSGTSPYSVIALGADGKLPAVDGSKLTGLTPTIGNFTRDATAGNGAVNVAHGLGRVPTMVRFFAAYSGGSSGEVHTTGAYNGTSQFCSYTEFNLNGSTHGGGTSITTAIHLGWTATSIGDNNSAVITWDATNIICTWTKTGSPNGTWTIAYEII